MPTSPRNKLSTMPRTRSARPERPPASPAKLAPEVHALLQNFRLEDVPSHLLRRAHFKAEEIFANTFSGESVTPRQKAALILLYQDPGLSQNSLAERLAMDRNTVAEMVKRMHHGGLVERRPSPTDARAYQLYVAPAGVALLSRIMPRDVAVEDELLARLPEEYRGLFVKCLRLIADDRGETQRPHAD